MTFVTRPAGAKSRSADKVILVYVSRPDEETTVSGVNCKSYSSFNQKLIPNPKPNPKLPRFFFSKSSEGIADIFCGIYI